MVSTVWFGRVVLAGCPSIWSWPCVVCVWVRVLIRLRHKPCSPVIGVAALVI